MNIPTKTVNVIRISEAVAWDEKKHPRNGGKFASKNGPGGPSDSNGSGSGGSEKSDKVKRSSFINAAVGAVAGAGAGLSAGGIAGAGVGAIAGAFGGTAVGNVAGRAASIKADGRASGLVKDLGQAEMNFATDALKSIGLVVGVMALSIATRRLGPKVLNRVAQAAQAMGMAKEKATNAKRVAKLAAMTTGGVLGIALGAEKAVGVAKTIFDVGKAGYNFATNKYGKKQ